MTDRPNLLLILTDHWRGDSLGRLGHPVADTPHLDSLSAGGPTFTRAYTPCPSCIAARRSLMTGMTPYSQGMVGYQDGKPWDYEHTLAGTLRDSGNSPTVYRPTPGWHGPITCPSIRSRRRGSQHGPSTF